MRGLVVSSSTRTVPPQLRRAGVQVLAENGADLQSSLVLTLWNIIQRLRPSTAAANGSQKKAGAPAGSGLARADDRRVPPPHPHALPQACQLPAHIPEC